jgi:hypothetical protein
MRTTYHRSDAGVNRYVKLSLTRMGVTMSDNIPTPPADPPKTDPPADPPKAPTPTPAPPAPTPPAPTPPTPTDGDAGATLLAAISALPERVANAVREATPQPPADPPKAADNDKSVAKRKSLASWWFGD